MQRSIVTVATVTKYCQCCRGTAHSPREPSASLHYAGPAFPLRSLLASFTEGTEHCVTPEKTRRAPAELDAACLGTHLHTDIKARLKLRTRGYAELPLLVVIVYFSAPS
ncbi:unnamed protein product [Lota lota]